MSLYLGTGLPYVTLNYKIINSRFSCCYNFHKILILNINIMFCIHSGINS